MTSATVLAASMFWSWVSLADSGRGVEFTTITGVPRFISKISQKNKRQKRGKISKIKRVSLRNQRKRKDQTNKTNKTHRKTLGLQKRIFLFFGSGRHKLSLSLSLCLFFFVCFLQRKSSWLSFSLVFVLPSSTRFSCLFFCFVEEEGSFLTEFSFF